jgi:UDP-N-acetylmuramoyl-tripeptide--D-alanyl-D-alanine ligase
MPSQIKNNSKNFLKNIVTSELASLSRTIIKKYKPTIIMVTGSVGKTSTKDAIAAALSKKFFVRKSDKSFNSDFGVPLTIIGVKNPWSNAREWFSVFRRAFAIILLPTHYPKLLVLEVGADRPGDLAKIIKIAQPDMVVVTLLPQVPVHVEAYESPRAVREEEFVPALALRAGAPLVYCADDEHAEEHSTRLDAHRITFGVREGSDVHLSAIRVWIEQEFGKGRVAAIKGMQADVTINDKKYAVQIPGALGRSQLFAPAAAIAAAVSLNLTVEDALEGLKGYVPPPGRGRIFPGIHESLIIDDSYNSSPAAVEEILRSLELIPRAHRRIAILGDMLELGRYSSAEHARIGHIAKEYVDVLLCVGPRARAIGEAAFEDGMHESDVLFFEDSTEAAEKIPALIKEEDIVLVKGSQGIRLERLMEVLIANPEDVSELVRQESEWKKR